MIPWKQLISNNWTLITTNQCQQTSLKIQRRQLCLHKQSASIVYADSKLPFWYKKKEEEKSYHVSKQRTGNCYKIHTMAIENKFLSLTIPTRKISKNHSSQSLVFCKLCTWKVNWFDFCCQWTRQARRVQMTAECKLGCMTGWPMSLKCLHCLTSSTQ